MTDQLELLPCPNPWCEDGEPGTRGGTSSLKRPWYQVLCSKCGITGPVHATKPAAVAAWNTRKGTDGGDPADESWRDAAQPAPEGQPVLALYKAWDRPNGKLMKHVVWWWEGDWRVYPFTGNRGHVDPADWAA